MSESCLRDGMLMLDRVVERRDSQSCNQSMPRFDTASSKRQGSDAVSSLYYVSIHVSNSYTHAPGPRAIRGLLALPSDMEHLFTMNLNLQVLVTVLYINILWMALGDQTTSTDGPSNKVYRNFKPGGLINQYEGLELSICSLSLQR